MPHRSLSSGRPKRRESFIASFTRDLLAVQSNADDVLPRVLAGRGTASDHRALKRAERAAAWLAGGRS